MRNFHYRFMFAIIISALAIFLAGCAIGIRPRDYDEIPEDDVYYEESVYGSYNTGYYPSSSHYCDPNYDPWTMGTYYQNYSGPPRTDRSSGSSNASNARADNKRPAVKGRDSTSTHQTKAPDKGTTSIKRTRSTSRQYNKSSSSSVSHRKARSTSRGTTQKKQTTDKSRVSRRRTQTRTSSQKPAPSPVKTEKEDEDENKKTQD